MFKGRLQKYQTWRQR